MKPQQQLLLLGLSAHSVAGMHDGVHPIHKVMEMLTVMQTKIIRQGTDFQGLYETFSTWCADRSRELHQEIKEAKSSVANTEGIIEKESDKIGAVDTKIGEFSAQLSTDESDLKAIGLIREKEKKEFDRTEVEMRDMISALQHAIAVLERQLKGGASLAQLSTTSDMVKVFSTILEAMSLNDADTKVLTSLVQSRTDTEASSDEEEDDDAVGAPDPDAYQSKSTSIVETLESLLDKAQGELDEQRTSETEKNSNFQLLKQVLENKIKNLNKEMEDAKKAKAEAGETKATAEGDLSGTKTAMVQDVHMLRDLHHKCMAKAADFQQETKTRNEEMKAITKAKSVIGEMMEAGSLAQKAQKEVADDDDESSDSFLQVRMRSKAQAHAKTFTPMGVKIVHLLKARAKKLQSEMLVQFATSLDTTIRDAAVESRNPLASVKQLISDMISKLEKEAGEAADHKEYCDRELAHAEEKERNKQDDSEGLTTRIDKMRAKSAKLAEQLTILQTELSEITKTQSEMDKLRESERANFNRNKPEMEESIQAVQKAMAVLRDFYAKGDKDEEPENAGQSNNIIGMLEVVESDFSKELSNMIAEEEAAQASYEETTKENEIAKAAKDQDVKFKTSRSKTLAKAASEYSTDRDGMQTEIEAAQDYISRLKAMCIAKPEPYEERKKRREAELASLQDALEMLSSASLLQEGATRHLLRGSSHKEQ